jgi:O-antigen/teichoic acid export membrane protein
MGLGATAGCARRGVVRNLLTLAGGTTVAQAIAVVGSLVLARLYQPNELGVLTWYLSISALTSAVATGRYELAIMLPEDDGEGFHVLIVGVTCVVVAAVLFLSATLIAARRIIDLMGGGEIAPYLWTICLSTCLGGLVTVLGYWFTRKRLFRLQAMNRMLQSASTVLVQLALGALGWGSVGLLVGAIAGQVLCVIHLAWHVRRSLPMGNVIALDDLWRLAKRYSRFPLVSVWGVAANHLCQLLPISFLGASYGMDVVGYYGMGQKLLGMPSSLIGGAVSQVFFGRAIDECHRTGRSFAAVRETVLGLLGFSLLPFLFMAFFGPGVVSGVLGHTWRTAGEYAAILLPLYWTRFLVSPVSVTTSVHEKQWAALAWQVGLVVITYGCLACTPGRDVRVVLRSLAWGQTLWYMILFVIVVVVSRNAHDASSKRCL